MSAIRSEMAPRDTLAASHLRISFGAGLVYENTLPYAFIYRLNTHK
jgi:hypothetical protein